MTAALRVSGELRRFVQCVSLVRGFQPDDTSRVLPNLDHPPVEALGGLLDRRLIIGAL
jgi:hypothetical protein